ARRSKDRDLEGHRCATKDLRRRDSGNGFKEGQNKSRGPPPGGCATECEFEIRRRESKTENRETELRISILELQNKVMEVRSIYKYARISPIKAREVTREIQGLPVSAALDLLAITPKKAAFLINKTLKSAIANAENNANLKPDGLVVKEAVVGEGPTFKRIMARARGSASRILKRTSHIRIVLTDEIKIETRETRRAKQKATRKAEKKKEGAAGDTPETATDEKKPRVKKASKKSNK